jgi:hypothetical protein
MLCCAMPRMVQQPVIDALLFTPSCRPGARWWGAARPFSRKPAIVCAPDWHRLHSLFGGCDTYCYLTAAAYALPGIGSQRFQDWPKSRR